VLEMDGARQRWELAATTLARSGSFVIFVPSRWRIADPRLVVAYPRGFCRTGKVSLVTPAILHHEGTKITKERECRGAAGGHGLRIDGNRLLPTYYAIRTSD